VERYDSHCVWINTCVGASNHNYYLSFLWFVWLDLLLIICIAMDSMGEGMSKVPYEDQPLGSLCLFCKSKNYYYFNCMFDMIICGIYFVPATLLFYIHVKNYCLGKTTYERLGKRSKSG